MLGHESPLTYGRALAVSRPTAQVAGNAPAQSTAPATSSRSPASVVPPTSTNVSVDPITDAADRAKCGYRCDAKAATRDGKRARPRYA